MKKNWLSEKIAESFERFSANIALEFGDSVVSFSELGAFSQKIENFLAKKKVDKAAVIAVSIEKNLPNYAMLISLARLGISYLPIDPKLPQARIDFLLQKSGARYSWGIPSKNLDPANVFSLEALKEIQDSTEKRYFSQEANTSPFCLLATSGSTGEPKLVELSRMAVEHFILWSTEETKLSPKDRIYSMAAWNFDLSFFDIFSSLVSGATLVFPSTGVKSFPSELAKEIERRKISIIYTVPTTYKLLAGGGKLEERNFSALRLLISAGEDFHLASAKKIKKHSKAQFMNWYGPTETNVCSAYTLLDEQEEPIPIGLPIRGHDFLLLDDFSKPMEGEGSGELLVSGPQLMSEYVNDNMLTEKSFFPHAGKKFYRTGDLAFKKAGLYYLLGRKDRQFKHLGYRVHPKEIEQQFSHHFKCNCRAYLIDEKLLCLAVEIEKIGDEQEYTKALAEHLPAYMLPQKYISVSSFPKNANGKMDDQAIKKLIRDFLKNS